MEATHIPVERERKKNVCQKRGHRMNGGGRGWVFVCSVFAKSDEQHASRGGGGDDLFGNAAADRRSSRRPSNEDELCVAMRQPRLVFNR